MKSLSVKLKMWLASLFVVLSLAATWAVDAHFYGTVNANHDVRHLLDRVHSHMQALRQAEKNFIASKDPQQVRRFDKVFEDYLRDHRRLQARMTDAGLRGDRIRDVHALFLAYRENFLEVVGKQNEIGLTWSDGHYGALRESAEKVEKIISEDDGLMRALLTLRRHEKDFMLNRDVLHASAFISGLAPFRDSFFMSDIDNVTKARAQSALREYASRFEQLVALEKEIGLGMESGILGEMTASVQAMEKAFGESRRAVDRMIEKQLRDSRRYSLALVASVMAVAVLMLMFINRGISRSLVYARDVAGALARGEWQREIIVRGRDEFARLLRAMVVMRDELVAKSAEIEQESEVRGRHSELAAILRGEPSEEELCHGVIRYLVPVSGCQVGAVYLRKGEHLSLAAGYGLSLDQQEEIDLGEGLVGQVAKTAQTRLVRDVPEDYCRISSGTGTAAPRRLLLVPLLWNGQVYGVVELGSFADIDSTLVAFMDQAGEAIAIALNVARNRAAMQQVLEKTRRQADELEARQREKQGALVRLEEQAEKLQASEEELRAQEEELRVMNEELESRTRLLHEKNREVEARNRELERLLEERRMAG